jgi:hypothetical protein
MLLFPHAVSLLDREEAIVGLRPSFSAHVSLDGGLAGKI